MKVSAVWAILVAVVGVWLYGTHQQQVGALQAALHTADSTHVADSVRHQFVSDSAVAARAEASRLRDAARRELLLDQRAHARTDSALRVTAGEREAARALLRDSAATTGELRAEVGRLLVAHQSDSVAYTERANTDERTIASLLRAVIADSAALDKSVAAEKSAILRAVASEHAYALLKKSQPSKVGTFLRTGATVGLTILAVKVLR